MNERNKARLFRVRDQLVSILDLAISCSEFVRKEANALNLKVLKGVMLEETSKDISRIHRFIDQQFIVAIDHSVAPRSQLLVCGQIIDNHFKIQMRNGMTKFNFYLELFENTLFVVNVSVINPHFTQVA